MIELTLAVHQKKKEFETAQKLSPKANWANYKSVCASLEPVNTNVEVESGAPGSCMSELQIKLSKNSADVNAQRAQWYDIFAFDMILTKRLFNNCSCESGLPQMSVQYALLQCHGSEKDCGSWFTFFDTVT